MGQEQSLACVGKAQLSLVQSFSLSSKDKSREFLLFSPRICFSLSKGKFYKGRLSCDCVVSLFCLCACVLTIALLWVVLAHHHHSGLARLLHLAHYRQGILSLAIRFEWPGAALVAIFSAALLPHVSYTAGSFASCHLLSRRPYRESSHCTSALPPLLASTVPSRSWSYHKLLCCRLSYPVATIRSLLCPAGRPASLLPNGTLCQGTF